jgi:hypothetical protein
MTTIREDRHDAISAFHISENKILLSDERLCSRYHRSREAMTHDRLVFGVTIDQIDELNSLLRTITANGDMVTNCYADALHARTVSTVGEAIFSAALAVGEVFDKVKEQRLQNRDAGS